MSVLRAVALTALLALAACGGQQGLPFDAVRVAATDGPPDLARIVVYRSSAAYGASRDMPISVDRIPACAVADGTFFWVDTPPRPTRLGADLWGLPRATEIVLGTDLLAAGRTVYVRIGWNVEPGFGFGTSLGMFFAGPIASVTADRPPYRADFPGSIHVAPVEESAAVAELVGLRNAPCQTAMPETARRIAAEPEARVADLPGHMRSVHDATGLRHGLKKPVAVAAAAPTVVPAPAPATVEAPPSPVLPPIIPGPPVGMPRPLAPTPTSTPTPAQTEPAPPPAAPMPQAEAAATAAPPPSALAVQLRLPWPLGYAFRGTRLDEANAVETLRAAALKGDGYAVAALAALHERGIGVSADHGLADMWLKLLKEHAGAGNASAQAALGAFHRYGHLVPRDPVQARYWLRRADEKGDALATAEIGAMLRDGIGEPVNLEHAAIWFQKATERGSPAGAVELGQAFEAGRGVGADPIRAARLYDWAGRQGYGAGDYRLGALYRDGKGVKADPQEAFARFRSAERQATEPAIREAAFRAAAEQQAALAPAQLASAEKRVEALLQR